MNFSFSRARRLADRVRDQNLTYLEREALVGLFDAARRIERARVPGRIVEAGTALGGSAVVLAAAKSPARPLDLFDVFGLIPPPSDRDGEDVHARYQDITSGKSSGIGADTYYGYQDDLITKVAATLARLGYPPESNGIRLIKGLYEDTLHPEGPIALAHIDCDWYDSVTVCLERICPLVPPGGVLVIDDYLAWSGCRTATDDYFRGRDGWRFEENARLHVVKL
jgi:asparagine synthase (glutamine-hydrolysing)